MKKPRTLREILLLRAPNGPKHTLNQRLTLMKNIASGLAYVHKSGHFHKNINPRSILVFEESNFIDDRETETPRALGPSYLIGFEFSRRENTTSLGNQPTDKQIAMYISPDRVERPGADYSYSHDLYSLGVLFLEIAVWKSFWVKKTKKDDKSGRLIYVKDGDEHVMCEWSELLINRLPAGTQDLKDRYIEIARTTVPRLMGDTIAEIIIECLRCAEINAARACSHERKIDILSTLEKLWKLFGSDT
ncbi:hypothetical protein ABW20_dc0108210 [Dactylellina cionopaga]|nr:hypothetical protein ABW20_dc0108210 [Dactylellina cionopaga]